MHEIAIITSFLTTHDQKTSLRFLLHERVLAYAAMKLWHRYHSQLGASSPTENDLTEGKREYDEIISVHGKEMKIIMDGQRKHSKKFAGTFRPRKRNGPGQM